MPKARGTRHPDAAAKLAFKRNFLGRDLSARSQTTRQAALPALTPLRLYDAGGVRAVSSKTLRIYNIFEQIVKSKRALKRMRHGSGDARFPMWVVPDWEPDWLLDASLGCSESKVSSIFVEIYGLR
jgi:hypothetical protein